MSRSKSSRQSGKNSRKKKGGRGKVPFAGDIIQAWRRMEELDQRSIEAAEAVGLDSPEIEKLQVQWSKAAFRFEGLLARAYDNGAFKHTISSVKYQMQSERIEDLMRLLEDMARFHKDPEYLLRTTQGEEVIARIAIYGVPAVGEREHMKEMAADSKFAALQRATGFAPEQSNVMSFGVLTAADALMLAHDPLKMWDLARDLFAVQARALVGGSRIEGLMQKSVDGADIASRDETTVGGYVILMAVFAEGDEPIEAVDGPEESTIEAWLEASQDYRDGQPELGGYADMPCELADAARTAVALQMMQTIQIAHVMENPDMDADSPKDAAFIYNDDKDRLDLVARFEIGSQVRIPDALPVEMLPFLPDIAEAMEIPTSLTTDADLGEWHALLDGAENEESLDSESELVPRPPRARMH